MQPARFLGLLVLVVTLLLHTSGRLAVAQAPAAGGPTVTMKDFEFTPKEIKVKVGTTVTWTNAGYRCPLGNSTGQGVQHEKLAARRDEDRDLQHAWHFRLPLRLPR